MGEGQQADSRGMSIGQGWGKNPGLLSEDLHSATSQETIFFIGLLLLCGEQPCRFIKINTPIEIINL
jgi:hypothetical protein